MLKEIVVGLFKDGSKEIYDPVVHGIEKPGVVAYKIQVVTREEWEWILSHPSPSEAIHRYFPNI